MVIYFLNTVNKLLTKIGLLDVLNAHFQTALGITQGMSGGLQAAYFGQYTPQDFRKSIRSDLRLGAYAIGPLTYSGWLVRRFGYRWTFIAGLCIYGVGALMMWPSAVKRSFGGFCGAMFIIGKKRYGGY